MKILSSEWLRTKRTAIRWLTFCMPIVFASLVISYMALRKDVTEAFIYEAFLLYGRDLSFRLVSVV